MPLPRRTLLALPLGTPALAQPARPLRLLLGFPLPAIPDLVSRTFALALGKPVPVENRLSSGGALAAEALLRAPPDGQTLMMMAQSPPVLPAVQRNLPFDVAEVLPLAATAQVPPVTPGPGTRHTTQTKPATITEGPGRIPPPCPYCFRSGSSAPDSCA